jgi:hypothetical protein
MNASLEDLAAERIVAFHDEGVRDPAWAARAPSEQPNAAWQSIDLDHRCNCLIWDEEDLARRRNVPDAAIVTNKRAIDRYNQQRNDAIEKIDEAILDRLAGVTPAADAWRQSETAGAMIDRLSVLALKIHHMGLQTRRADATPENVETWRARLTRLIAQRDDLARCLDTLLARCAEGRAFYRIYRQFKMYNDPDLNPHLRGSKR